MEKGKLLIISGPSGSGKSFVADILKNEFGFVLSVSYSTRKPRPCEKNGVNYFFISNEEFDEKVASGELLEHAQYTSGKYGTPKEFVINRLEQGENVILEIDIQGARQVKQKYPEVQLFMLTPPNDSVLVKRLRGRKDTSEEEMSKRLRIARGELEHLDEYDYIIVNRDGESMLAASQINDIINGISPHPECKVENNPDFLKHFYGTD